MWFRGGRWDGGDGGGNLRLWKEGGQDVLSCNVLLRIVSKVLVDKRVLGGCREEILFFVLMVLGFVGGDMGEDVKTNNWGGGDGGASDNIGGTVRDIEEREVLNIVKGRPDRSGGWGILEFRGLRGDGLKDMGGNVKRTWVIPSVVRALEDLEDGGSGVRNILLVDVIKGGPGGNGDVEEGGGGNGGGLRSMERHLILN